MTTDSGKPRILVVEDDLAALTMIEKLVRPFAEVIRAKDGEDGWTCLERGPLPALVITDLMMPRMDGMTLLRKIKSTPETRSVPVILLTAQQESGGAIAGVNAGAVHYLTKPFTTEQFVEKVRKALRIVDPQAGAKGP